MTTTTLTRKLRALAAKKGGLSWRQFIGNGLVYRTNQLLDPIVIPLYRRTIGRKVRRMRRQPVVTVAFVVPELGVWKTEAVYRAMLSHERFRPLLLIVPSTEVPQGASLVADYCRRQGYDYIDMRQTADRSIRRVARPDIIFYQKPYDYSLPAWASFRRNGGSLFCYVSYCYHTMKVRDIFETPLISASWQVYYENDVARRDTEQQMLTPKDNGVVTGLPNSDDFMRPATTYADPWKDMGDGRRRRRIIWAPHHSVGFDDHHGMDYSTFFQFADFMLDAARRHADTLQFAFKPHPLLRGNLRPYWSEERIDDYYNQWATMPNTQLELGDYKALFMHSDAMVHDCGSFTIEYLYTRKPVMYLLKHHHHDDNLNEFALQAFRMHYMGKDEADVERFLEQVENGQDPQADRRRQFYENSLQPPGGHTASQNILDAILG